MEPKTVDERVDELALQVSDLIEKAEVLKNDVGRGEHGRHLALVSTKLEEAFLWLRAKKLYGDVLD